MISSGTTSALRKPLVNIFFGNAHHRTVLSDGKQLFVHGVAQRLVAEIEADGVLLNGDGLGEDNIVALGVGDLVVTDADIHDNGVDRALTQLKKSGVIVGKLDKLAEGGGQLFVRGERVETGGGGLHHNGLSGEIGERFDTGVGADDGDDAVIDIGVRPGVLLFTAGAGEAVPDAVDVSGLELGVLRRPVNRHGLILPAEPRADFLREREIEAVIAAVLGDVAERGELGVEADDQFAGLGGGLCGGLCRSLRRSFGGRGGRIGGGGAAAAAGQRRCEQTKHKCYGKNPFHGWSLLCLIYYGSILARYHTKVNTQKKQKEREQSSLFCYFTINPPPRRRSPS